MIDTLEGGQSEVVGTITCTIIAPETDENEVDNSDDLDN